MTFLNLTMLRMLKPLVFGDYPDAMKRVWGSRLPVFSEEESEKVKGSSDFVGIIHYTTVYVRNSTSTTPSLIPRRQDFFTDMGAETICKIYFLFHSSMDQNMASWFLYLIKYSCSSFWISHGEFYIL